MADYREQRPLPRFVVKSPKSCDDVPLVGPVIRDLMDLDFIDFDKGEK